MAAKFRWWGSKFRHSQKGDNTTPTYEIKLVKGFFSPPEAADVLLSLINDKIKFHTVQSLNLKNRHGDINSHSEVRIKELKQAKSQVKEMVLMARDQGIELEINGTIQIKLKRKLKT